jgi:fucose permease
VDIYLTSMQIAALSIAGMCHALLGSIKVPLARQLEIDEARVGGLASVFGFTIIPMAFATGILADAWGRNEVVATGCLLMIVSVIVLAHLKTYRAAIVSILLLGTGWSALVNVLNPMQGPAFLSIDAINKANLPFAMNLGDFIFGVGALVMPIAMLYSLQRIGLKKTFMIFAVLIMIPLILSLNVDLESFAIQFYKIMNAAEPATAAPAAAAVELGFVDLLTDRLVIVCCLAFFFHVPIEACVAIWATTLMIDRGAQEKSATMLLSAFWLTFTLSRLIAALFMPKGSHHALVIVLAIILLLVILGLVASRDKRRTVCLLMAAGLILGPIFPILIAFLLGHVAVSVQGRAVGLFFCIGGIGWAVVPFVVGRMADRVGLQKSFLVVAGCAGGLIVMSVILYMLG